jgi:transporter family-2 protein
MASDDVLSRWYVGTKLSSSDLIVVLGGLLAILAGIAFATQGGLNARNARSPGSNPAFSSLQSFFVGTLCCFVFTVIWSHGFQGINVKLAFQEGPWWQWMGGFMGFIVLVVNILEIPRLGAGTVIAVLVSSLVIFVRRWHSLL